MTELSILHPLPLASATDQVFDALYRAIISLELPPGAKVSEADIAKQLGVSRQPVRDAFFRLSKLGFLLIRPQRATLITKISERAVLEAAFIRIALEVACIQAALPILTEENIEELRDLLKAQQSAVDRDARAEFHQLDDAFHKRICEMAGHGHAWTLIQEQKAHMDRVRFLSLSQDGQLALDEHGKVMDALEARDPDLTEKNLRQHLSRIIKIVSRIRKEHGQYFEDET